jgi:hypothetical protein
VITKIACGLHQQQQGDHWVAHAAARVAVRWQLVLLGCLLLAAAVAEQVRVSLPGSCIMLMFGSQIKSFE